MIENLTRNLGLQVAQFEKVSFEQFIKDVRKIFGADNPSEEGVQIHISENLFWQYYNEIKLPTRATSGSAGYDFKSPYGFEIKKGETQLIPTGIRCKIKNGWFLACCPRSGLGFKYGVSLTNTLGIIDSDYYNSDNEGHIMLKLKTDKSVVINQGEGIMQGIFLPYGLTIDDTTTASRNGGFGSTDKK